MFEAILRRLRRFVPPGATLLDVGCSYGGFLEMARNEGYRVRGVDIVPEAVEYVRSRDILCDRAASLANLDVPYDSQDIVSVLDCNYYWPNHRRELRCIHALLRPGGLLVMRVVDTSRVFQVGMWMSNLFRTLGSKLCERVIYDHRVSVPVASLLTILSEENFSIVDTSVRDALSGCQDTLKKRAAYALGNVSWHVARYNLVPGFVLLARKGTPASPIVG
jgi:SAM-dependent methyltransferase